MTVKTRKNYRNMLPGLLALGTAAVLLITVLAVMGLTRPEPVPEVTEPPTVAANPYTAEDFTYDGDYLTCTAGTSVLGIDISSHQGDIDWAAVKEAGVEFVMIRLGYRGSREGMLYTDQRAQENYDGAKAAGLKVGAYFFSQAVSLEEAEEEAALALSIAEGWALDMPLVYDWEYAGEEARTANMDARQVTDCTKAFCEAVENAGFDAMIYFNVSQSRYLLYLEELTAYPFWLAMYTDEMDFEYQVHMWQYTCTGTVPGIETDVDINLWLPADIAES